MGGEKCNNPECSRKANSRGLCTTCYSTLVKAVKAGKTTWEELEAEGMMLPRKRAESTALTWLRKIRAKKKKGTAR